MLDETLTLFQTCKAFKPIISICFTNWFCQITVRISRTHDKFGCLIKKQTNILHMVTNPFSNLCLVSMRKYVNIRLKRASINYCLVPVETELVIVNSPRDCLTSTFYLLLRAKLISWRSHTLENACLLSTNCSNGNSVPVK